MANPEVVHEVAEYLERRRRASAARARSEGIEPSWRIPVPTVESDSFGEGERVSYTPMSVSAAFPRLTFGLLDDVNAEHTERLLRTLHEEFGERCISWPLREVTDDPSDESIRRNLHARIVVPAMSHYLISIESLDQADESLARRIAGELIAHLESDTVVTWTGAVLGGIGDIETATVDDVLVRQLTPEERGLFAEPPDELPTRTPWSPVPLRFDLPAVLIPTHLLAIRREVDRQQLSAPADPRLRDLVVALQLLGVTPHGPGLGTRWVEPVWLTTWYGGLRLHVRPLDALPTGTERLLTEALLREAHDLAQRLPRDGVEPARARTAVHRFSLAHSRTDSIDQLVDHVVALEAALLPNVRGGLGFRLALHGATLLAESPGQRRQVFDRLSTIYQVRSRVVHGGRPKVSPDDAAVDAHDLARQVIVACIEQGWPNRREFEAMSIGYDLDNLRAPGSNEP